MKKIIRISIAIVWLLVMALPAFANSSNYAWDMPWDGYYVNGKNNGVLHSLTAGTLTNSGSLWEYYKIGGASATPHDITIEVWRVDTIFDNKICSITVTPYTTLYQKKYYSQNGGTIIADDYYIVVWKNNEQDGWSTAGSGTLTSQ